MHAFRACTHFRDTFSRRSLTQPGIAAIGQMPPLSVLSRQASVRPAVESRFNPKFISSLFLYASRSYLEAWDTSPSQTLLLSRPKPRRVLGGPLSNSIPPQ